MLKYFNANLRNDVISSKVDIFKVLDDMRQCSPEPAWNCVCVSLCEGVLGTLGTQCVGDTERGPRPE